MLDGVKRFITNAGVAHTYVVFARAEAGIRAFMVEADDPGFAVGRIEPKMGIKGSTTGELLLDSCRIPGDRLIGEEGSGFRLAMRVLDRSRPGHRGPGAGHRPGARSTTPPATPPSGWRSASRSPTSRAIQFMLADMATALEAAPRAGVPGGGDARRRRRRLGADQALGDVQAAGSDAAMGVTTDAVQILGGYGYIQEFPVERMMRDAKITQIYEGTNQIQRVVIAREILRGLG